MYLKGTEVIARITHKRIGMIGITTGKGIVAEIIPETRQLGLMVVIDKDLMEEGIILMTIILIGMTESTKLRVRNHHGSRGN